LFVEIVKADKSRVIIWIAIGLGSGVFLLGLVLVIIILRHVQRVKREKRAKERIIKFIIGRREENVPLSLRQKLNLKPEEHFSAELAAHRIMEFTEKSRNKLIRHLTKHGGMVTGGQAEGIKADAHENMAAIDRLLGRKMTRSWQLPENEPDVFDACRKVRGMFQQDGFSKEFGLRTGALPEHQQNLASLQMENEKLKRLMASVKKANEGGQPEPKQDGHGKHHKHEHNKGHGSPHGSPAGAGGAASPTSGSHGHREHRSHKEPRQGAAIRK
jgi:hypothetical protein